ncbi:MAG: hypothetical protein NZ561_08240 [Phycisphaerae bacterium]|nr:hypothetical protein [Phycisphaerae bacterium]MDW8262752.1 hypothetical protein [Phycisphaerales bacterium]
MTEVDVEQTDIVIKLFETPPPQRDAEWLKAFLAAVPTAAFAMREGEEVFTGPDGFPYLRLSIPPLDTEFRAFSIRHLLERALESGVGAAIFPEDQSQPLWVFTYGNLLSYRICRQFDARSPQPPPTVPPDQQQVMISQPSEEFLPTVARKVIRKYLSLNGVGLPAMFLLNDPSRHPPQQLVFNLFRENYQSQEHFNDLCYRLTWYLPPHYGFIVVPKGHPQFEQAFVRL